MLTISGPLRGWTRDDGVEAQQGPTKLVQREKKVISEEAAPESQQDMKVCVLLKVRLTCID